MKRLTYHPDLEGLRAVAILLVVAAHAGVPGLRGGFIGVDMFFVLSGYLITALLTLEIQAADTVNFWAFYVRRFRRLVPGLLLMLLVACVLAELTFSPMRRTDQAGAAMASAVWASNFHFAFGDLDYFGSAAESNLFLHTWSLGVEEQFYLVWPLLLLTFSGFQRESGNGDKSNTTDALSTRQRHLKIAMLLVFTGSLMFSFWLMAAHPISAFYMMPARAW